MNSHIVTERLKRPKRLWKMLVVGRTGKGQAIKTVMIYSYLKRRIVLKKEGESFLFVRSRWLYEEERRNISSRSNTASA